MACLARFFRFGNLRHFSSAVSRNITSNNVALQTPLIPITIGHKWTNNHWIWQINNKIESPLISKLQIDFPNGLKYVPPVEDPSDNKELELPTTPSAEISKQAVRMIVIRRRKMKKHKLKKLRKRMKFEWAKRRQRREWNKEKLFQAKLIQQCKEGESFSAEKYVEEKLAKFNEIVELKKKPKRWGIQKTPPV